MKLNNLSRLTALLLALTIFMTSVAFADSVAVSDYTADDYASQLQAAYIAAYAYDGTADVGKYAKFAESEDFIAVYDNDPDLSYDVYSFAYEDFLEGTIVRITDWAWMSSTSALLYKVEFYRGGVIEEYANDWPAEAWVLQCYTDSNEFASLEFVTICEDCGEPDCNIDHNPPDTEAVIPEKPTLTEGEAVSLVDANGKPITNGEILRIKEGTKYSLSAWTGLEDHGDETYQWQISAEETGGVWVNISGQTSKGLLTSLAMFEAAFKTVPYIRCKITTGGQTLYSQEIPVAALAEATLTDSNSDVSVAGLLPLDATLNVTSTSLEETGLDNGAYPVGEASLFSDVTLYRAGSTYQPEEDETVTVTFSEASVTEAGLSAGDGYHIYHIHDGAVDISGIQQYNGGDIAMTFGSLSVVGISETTEVEKDLVEQHGEIVSRESVSLTLYFNSDSVVLYDNPEATGTATLYVTTVTGYFGAPVEAWQKITYTDNTVVYRIRDSADTPEELRATITEYPIVYATDVSEEIITDDPIMITKCAICGTENCTKQHLYCEEHSKFDCTENHEKAEPTKPLTGAVIPENLTFTPDADVCIADAKGNKVTSSFELPAGTQASLSAWPAGDAYQWQIKDKDGNWMDIRGKDQRGLLFSGALFADANAKPVIRCEVTVGGEVKHSAEIRVNVTTPAAEASLLSVARAADPVVTAEGDNLREYTVVINYVFEDNKVVANPYTATLAAGSNWSATVKNPTVMGYLPYVDNATETSESVEVKITNIQADVTYTVTYKPTNVNYTVIHYWQNIGDDNYSVYERETLQGLTGSTVPEVANTYPGMYALLYEKPAIAADGSTVVEVYYDRNYYLMLFNLGDGGYGVEPIYARYGAPVTVGTPTRPGYTFNGWSPAVPTKVPVDGGTYTAQWTAADTAKVTIVFWGENADDTGYSPLPSTTITTKPGTEFTYDPDGQLICGKEEHSHSAACGYDCGSTEHSHSLADNCYTLTCTQSTHNHVNDGCTLDCKHVHELECYKASSGTLTKCDKPDEELNLQGNGIYTFTTRETGWFGITYRQSHYYLNLGDSWYRSSSGDTNSISLDCSHSHGDECYTCGQQNSTHVHTVEGGCYELTCQIPAHTHTGDCYACGKTEHTHTSDCYQEGAGLDSNLWEFEKSDTVTVAADGSSVVNVYYKRTKKTLTFKYNYGSSQYRTTETITAKWGEDISDEYEAIAKNCGSTFWSQKTSGDGPYTNYFGIMPQTSATYYHRSANGNTGSMMYYGQDLNGDYSVKLFQVDNVGGYRVTDEDRYEFEGFTYHHGTSNQSSCSGATFYYTRNTYDIEFYNPTDLLSTVENVYYEAPLGQYDFTPTPDQAPDSYEPGTVRFEGWYLNPECTGEKYVLSEHTMPVGATNGTVALTLFANWVPVNRTVSFYLTKEEYDAGTSSITGTHPTLTVPHGSKVETVPAAPENGAYTFVNWFYIEDGVEKAFDFANMPITKDLQVYGKWSSNVLKEYIVYFKIQGTDTEIADPITGSTMAGETKTFDAKGGEELKPGYQEGYFPLVESHSMTLDIDTPEKAGTDANGTKWVEITAADGTKKIVQSFTFEYVQKDAVPYTVYYVAETLKEGESTEGKATIQRDGKTYYIIADTEQHDDNRKAVVTEQFKTVQGYMPDAYQKRLVVDGSDGAVNEIIFYYAVDTEHAYYKITHYTQNTDGVNWTEYASSQAQGVIGETYTADPLTIDGFTYDSTVAGTRVSGKLTADGLELKLYYTRNSYPYEVRYLEDVTGKQLANPKTGTGLYGKVISESPIGIPGYTAVDPTSQTLVIKIEESQDAAKLNIITFYYTEDEVTINYEPVGPKDATNFGSVDPTSETLKVLNGTAQGSTATATEYYQFVGWYTDAECTTAVTESDGTIDSSKFTPAKSGDLWTEKTYYAKFVEKTATINYVAVGPVGETNFGSVNPEKETVNVLTGVAQGSMATATTQTYKFVGWYSDVECQNLLSTDPKYVPTKESNVAWVDGTTYYAKFDWNVGQLAITKNVDYPAGYNFPDGVFLNDTFTFTVTLDDETINGKYGDATFENGVATITLKAGETATISKLVHGTHYTVTEDADKMPAGYFFKELSNADNQIVAGQTVTASFTNEYKVGSLTISKKVEGDKGVVPGDEFEFTLVLNNKQNKYAYVKGTEEGEIANNGKVTLKDGESITITGIPWGTDFTVTETENPNYTQSPDKVQGEIGADSKAEFTNTYLLGDLQITKRVVNDTGFTPTVSEFVIQVVLEGTNLNTAGYTVEGLTTGKPVNWDGSATKLTAKIPVTATLGTPATVTIKHLPAGTEYTVTESAPVGYTASIATTADNTNTTNKIDAGKMDAVEVTNTYKVGSLSVTKTVDGEVTEAYPSVFNFTLGLSNGVPVTNCKIQIADGATITMPENGQFTLATGQTAIITGIPDGVTYTVTETLIPDYFTTTATGENATENVVSGTVEDNGTDTADFTNTARTSDLTIEKNGMNSTNESAIVEVTVAGKTYMVVLNNANHWKAVIAGLPIGATYSATETSWTWRYTGTVSGGGTINKTEGTSKITVSNSPNGDKWLHDEDSKTNIFGTN